MTHRDASAIESETSVEVIPGGPVQGSIRPPGSKSLTNRALICAAFAREPSTVSGALQSEDTEVMIRALRAIGVAIGESDGGRRLRIDGSARSTASAHDPPVSMFIANSGTTVRFLTAALSAAGGNYVLHGVDRMHQRPIRDLIEAIAPVIDGSIEAKSPGGCPPVEIRSGGWTGADLSVAGGVSSQYLSGLMMAAPLVPAKAGSDAGLRIGVTGELVSRPYVDLTAEVMRGFGATVTIEPSETSGDLSVRVGGEGYRGSDYAIEPDASAASYFWAAAAITAGDVTVEGLSRHALQGDVRFCDVLQRMGCDVRYEGDCVRVRGGELHGVDVDMNQISDTVQTLAVVALFADSPTRVRGVAHNRFKETDRIGDLARELRKVGAAVDEHADGLTIHPLPQDRRRPETTVPGVFLETYDDHRMAMSFSLIGLRLGGVRILNPACTSKTYPEYFADLERLIGRPHRWSGA